MIKVCNKGDVGDCMYIIYKGAIGILIDGKIRKIFVQDEHLGRNALETDAPRLATLVCT